MDNLAKDPIIEIYLNYTKSTDATVELPLFSETLLRLAAKSALGNVRPIETETLILYRKLLLFHYATIYTAVEDLLKIMPCFQEDEVLDCFNNYHIVHNEWQTFTKEFLMYFIRKNAFFALYTEWARRYVHLHGKLNSKVLRDQAVAIHTFFGWSTKCVAQWIRSFERNVLKGNWIGNNDEELNNLTIADLALPRIAIDIQEKLHPLINEEVQELLKELAGSDTNNRNVDGDQKKCKYTKKPPKKKKKEENKQSEDMIIENPKLIHVQEIVQEESIAEGTLNQGDEFVQVYDISDFAPQTFESTPVEELSTNDNEDTQVIDDEKATQYLSALQAYAVVNGLFDAIGLLDQVDSILRAKLDKKT